MRAYSTFRVRTYQPMQCELASPSSAARCWVEVIAAACKLYIRSIAASAAAGTQLPICTLSQTCSYSHMQGCRFHNTPS